MSHPQKSQVFYGYWIVVATFLSVFITMGCGFYGFSLFVRPLQAELGWGRGEIMAALTMLILVQGIAAPFMGRLIKRHGARRVIFMGSLVSGLGFVLVSLTNSLWYFYLSYFVIGVGMTAMGTVPSSAIVSNWFKRRRGMAIGIMSSGIGAGGFVIAPLIGGYFIPNFGWRASYLVLALITWVVIIPIALLVIKTKPADMGLYPDGLVAHEAVSITEASTSTPEGLNLSRAWGTPALWLIAAGLLLSNFSQVGIVQSQVPHLQDIGFPVTTAAAALGAVALWSAVGKLGFGWLCDRVASKYACAIGILLQTIGAVILMNLGATSSTAVIWLYAIIMGLGVGSWLPTASMLTSTTFGLTDYGTIFGVVTLFLNTGAAAGPLMAGYMYDVMNTYQWAFIIFLVLYAISTPTILAVRQPKPL